ncbi:hypothetical protein V9T40_004182 [Parthenolecanium corni]|uniref:Uncharacterized protein n=1 Tax=Parthenolecanium corni TaxID=536013 RepID=A0AAN9TRH6_9HEMI
MVTSTHKNTATSANCCPALLAVELAAESEIPSTMAKMFLPACNTEFPSSSTETALPFPAPDNVQISGTTRVTWLKCSRSDCHS